MPLVPEEGRGNWLGRPFVKPATVHAWALLYAAERARPDDRLMNELKDVATALTNCGTDKGMGIRMLDRCDVGVGTGRAAPAGQPHAEGSPEKWIQDWYRAHPPGPRKGQPVMVICILEDENGDMYDRIKRVAMCRGDLVTQCMVRAKVQKGLNNDMKKSGRLGSDSMWFNNIMKMNFRMGGINHAHGEDKTMKHFRDKKTIVFGADVWHPTGGGGGGRTKTSISACVASDDRLLTSYTMVALDIEEPRGFADKFMAVEAIGSMRDKARRLVKGWEKKNGCFPEVLVYFRDGVSSEGQFEMVFEVEVAGIKQAFVDLGASIPQILCIVCQKRHDFRAVNVGRDGETNPSAGLVIDTDAVHPTKFQNFWMHSHSGTIGTARWTRYFVLINDTNIPKADIPILVHEMCHQNNRSSLTLALPGPTYLADKAAEMGMHLIDLHGVNERDELAKQLACMQADLQQHMPSVFMTPKGQYDLRELTDDNRYINANAPRPFA
eukprot:GHVT01043225.1.p1 GENE.GHVT01043225.1~~GHVT01043225.1.p1  ORF type:complete len:494 (+),score=65.15 GHVT01043225.1:126-1607(+)